MAAQTFTATTLPDQPRVTATGGLLAQSAKYVAATVTLSISDVIQMIRLPEGARIISGYLSGKCGGTASLVVKVGIGSAVATDDDLIASVTISATTKLTQFDGSTGLPYVSPTISADHYPKYNWVTITGVSGTTTASVSLQVTVVYDINQT